MARRKLRRGQNGAKAINAAMGGQSVTLTVGTETDVLISLDSGSADWTASGSGTGEYYYDTDTAQPLKVLADDVELVSGSLGSLAEGEFGYGDNDTIGSSRIYVRIAGDADPDTAPAVMKYVVEQSVTVTGQIVDDNGEAIDEAMLVTAMISDDASGDNVCTTAPDSVAITTGNIVASPVSKKLLTIQTNSAGLFTLVVEENGADVWYLAVFVGGLMSVSDALTFV